MRTADGLPGYEKDGIIKRAKVQIFPSVTHAASNARG